MDLDALVGRLQHATLPDDLNTPIWRYMDLWKFASMLDSTALAFARASTLGDPWEGSVTRSMLERRSLDAAAHAAWLQANGLQWTPEMVGNMLEATPKLMFEQVMINCWHVNSHESAAMWQLYTAAGSGVAIRSTVRRLVEALPTHHGDAAISVAEVAYIDYEHDDLPAVMHAGVPFLHKRLSFAHERELRAYLIGRQGDPTPAMVPVQLTDLVEEVYVAPSTPPWQLGVVKSLLGKYDLPVPALQSALDDPALR